MRRHLPVILLSLLVLCSGLAGAGNAPHSKLVYPGPDGRLVYVADERGNVIPDFSYAGYGGDGRLPPQVDAVMSIKPGGGDDTLLLQRSIDALAQRKPDSRGFRGALLLEPGEFRVSGTLYIRRGGIVLRGSGQAEKGTVLRATGRGQRSLIVVKPEGELPKYPQAGGKGSAVTDKYVPLGARSLSVQNPTGFAAGQLIVILRPSTQKWIHALGMDAIPTRGASEPIEQWKPGSRDIRYLRRLQSVDGNTLRFDAPVFSDLDSDYAPCSVYRYDEGVLIKNVGIEQLTLDSDYVSNTDEDHGWSGVEVDYCRDFWIRDVTSRHFGFGLANIGHEASQGTILDCRCLEPVSKIQGGRRYGFNCGGQNHLVKHCYTEDGRHDYTVGTNRACGTVFTDCVSRRINSSAEPHHRYSTGILYDNVVFEDPRTDLVLGLWNRGNYGTGHGWSAAWSVLWNCRAPGAGIACEKPPLAQNYAIGCQSATMSANMRWGRNQGLKPKLDTGEAHWEFWNEGPVEPQSLYEAQLADRLGQ